MRHGSLQRPGTGAAGRDRRSRVAEEPRYGCAAAKRLTRGSTPHLCRAGELTQEEVERLVTIIQNPRQFKVPDWMLNRKKDVKDGKFSQVVSNTLDMKLREDLERLKKIRAHRGLRHYCAPPPPTGELGTEGGWPSAGRACSSGGGAQRRPY